MRYRWDPVYPGHDSRAAARSPQDLRASDAERSEVADRLSRHFAEGRLDQTEFKNRLDRAMGAVTRGDLDGLFHDLPRLADDPEPTRSRRRLLFPVIFFLALSVVAVGSVVSAVHVSWLLVVLAGLFLWHRARHHRAGRRALPENRR